MTMLNLTGYRELNLLYSGTRTLVYRTLRLQDKQPVIIKVLRNQHPHFNELVQFRNQYIITRNLDSPYILKPLALERYGNSYALMMPDQGAVSLADYWPNNIPPQGSVEGKTTLKQIAWLSDFLSIALQLTDALHYLGQQRIIHKDIKPANILIHPETGQVQLIDFSLASLLPREQQQLVNPNGLEGTLAYISPEQTGRMNRGIDYRTDFYALGVTFYELLTGTHPFQSHDPMALIHAHIAQRPLFPDTSHLIPPPLKAIALKLMAKNAEDRYQSALGLKHDLERCLQSLETTGAIASFELGQRDVCDRFVLPERLYGRAAEVQELLNAFARVAQGSEFKIQSSALFNQDSELNSTVQNSEILTAELPTLKAELLLVAGFSGIGKTAVINEVHKPIVKQRGYFIKGKFDQFNQNIPFSAFVQACRDLMQQLLSESDAALAQWRTNILAAVGANGQVLIEVIPELEQIIGPQAAVAELSGTAAQSRFNLLFQKFIAVFTTPEHPLVVFLDDLQWADAASLQLLDRLVTEPEQGYLLMLGAYRDNEVFAAHPLILTLEKIRKTTAIVNTITLDPLQLDDLNQLVADTLRCTPELALPLTQLLHQKTRGNPFFATQFLKGLYEDGLIRFDADRGFWHCDLVQVHDAALTDDVVAFMVQRLHKLTPAAQTMMKLGACIGNQFSLDTLAIICDRPVETVAADLWQLLQAGLLLPLNKTYKFFQGESEPDADLALAEEQRYRFLHDRVQQAAYTLIPADQKQTVHLTIGRLLLRHSSPAQQAENLFEITNQLNQGLSLITELSERQKLTQLNLQAGCKARTATAYQAAGDYFNMGLSLLPPDAWHSHYNLTLALTENAAEAAFLQHDYTAMATQIATLKQNARSEFDCIKVYNIELLALYTQGHYVDCMDQGLIFLEKLGLSLPSQGTFDDIKAIVADIEMALGERAIADLANLPPMGDRRSLACMKILATLGPTTYAVPRNLTPLVVGHQVRLSIEQGNAPESAYAYAMYGLIVDSLTQDLHAAYAYGQLALALFAQSRSDEFAAKILSLANSVRHWFEPLRALDANYLAAYPAGLAVGDYYFGVAGLQGQASNAFYYGEPLDLVDEAYATTQAACHHLNQTHTLTTARIYRQTIWNLQGKSTNPCYLQGEQFDAQTWLNQQESGSEETGNIFFTALFQLILCYTFGDFAGALENAALAHQYLHVMPGLTSTPLLFFYGSLVRCALYGQASESEQAESLATITANQEKLKVWAETGPMNYLHKYQLVEAEKARILGDRLAAMDYYDQAIANAQANEYLQEEALANELAGQFFQASQKPKIAAVYLQAAYYGYARWGAKAKTDQLSERYPQLLAPIREQDTQILSPLESLESLTQTIASQTQTRLNTSTVSLNTIDFTAVLKSAQAIASTIEMDQLLGNIVEIILVNSGAEKTALLIPEHGQWQQRAIAALTSQGIQRNTIKTAILATNNSISLGVLQYVKNNLQPLLIDESQTTLPSALEYHLCSERPQSIFCLPLLNQGKLVAILYLEHSQTQGVFHYGRQTVTQFLCAQAAVAVHNAQLYHQAQTALQDLKTTQLQLVQKEKMSVLGNLIAGIAHEINNPLGFLSGNLQIARENLSDLLEHLALYEQGVSEADLLEHADDIDLDYLREDFTQLLASMDLGVERIQDISNSLRTFSRRDQDYKTEFNLHEGIDSTLLILKHRTKANDQRPKIEVIKHYGEIPEVECFPGQLNQVLMNIFANAIDAFDEVNQGKTYQEIETDPNTIAIKTSILGHEIKIEIQDNGCGMKPETVERIFEQGFTTKGVGKGTGLGMAIAHQIITEKHGGTIICTSEPGQGTMFTIILPQKA
ncbi:MAG: AAA family ATPase [Spirulina sp. SIO3F2]|nr:AAA family ATPase [Spirulina sp. SIO3F2]